MFASEIESIMARGLVQAPYLPLKLDQSWRVDWPGAMFASEMTSIMARGEELRLNRFTLRLPPRLPFRSTSDHSLLQCPPDILPLRSCPLMVQVPSLLFIQKETSYQNVSFCMVRDEGLEPPRSPART